MRDHRTRGVPERWLLPPAPEDPQMAARWEALPFDRRRALARVGPDDVSSFAIADREVVAGLARRRIATAWRLFGAAVVLSWLVLMAVWGFGRSTFPEATDAWLRAGVVLGVATLSVAGLAARLRVRRSHAMLAACDNDPSPDSDTSGGSPRR